MVSRIKGIQSVFRYVVIAFEIIIFIYCFISMHLSTDHLFFKLYIKLYYYIYITIHHGLDTGYAYK